MLSVSTGYKFFYLIHLFLLTVNPEPNTTPLPVTDKDVNSTIPKATKDDISLLDSDESCFHNHVRDLVR